MINYVHSEQLLVDWAFKTTYLFALGFNKAATQEPILRPDPTENFIEFIQEAKLYHTKLRDFITNQDFGLDIHETNVTDFDKPVHFDTSLEEFRVLDSNDVDDKAIMALSDAAQNSWFNTFSTAPELIRSLTTTLLFDRVSCDLAGGWDPTFGWDFGPNEGWDLALSDVNETAAERIIKFYNPQPFTVEDLDTGNIDPIIDLTALISGCDFKGTIVDGKDFNILDIDIDTLLDGGDGSSTAVDIIVDGNLFRQPDIDAGHPEELILNSVGEALAICVNSKERVNAPQVLTRRYVGFGVGPYPIDQIPASKDALWIYLNGVKQTFDDFDFDNVFNTVTFTSLTPGPTDLVVVTSFALGGAEESIIRKAFAGNGIDDTFTLSVTSFS